MKLLIIFTLHFGIILTYLLGRLALCHETQSKKFANFLLGETFDPFWRIISTAKVLPKDQSPVPSIPISTFPPTKQSLYNHRGDASLNLSHFSGIRTNRNVTALKAKWSLSIPHRVTHPSQSYHLKAFPSSNGPVSSTQIEKTSRPFAFINDPKTRSIFSRTGPGSFRRLSDDLA